MEAHWKPYLFNRRDSHYVFVCLGQLFTDPSMGFITLKNHRLVWGICVCFFSPNEHTSFTPKQTKDTNIYHGFPLNVCVFVDGDRCLVSAFFFQQGRSWFCRNERIPGNPWGCLICSGDVCWILISTMRWNHMPFNKSTRGGGLAVPGKEIQGVKNYTGLYSTVQESHIEFFLL